MPAISILNMCDRARKWRLLEEILRPEAVPDLLTVQECDHFPDFFQPALAACGYDGVFAPKARSPSLRFGYYSDGVAIFWRRGLFERLPPGAEGEGPADEHSSPPVAHVSVNLKHIPSGKVICANTCHLKAKREHEATRQAQAATILGRSPGAAAEPAMLLMGDFNTTPTEHCTAEDESMTVIEYVKRWRDGYLSSAYPIMAPADASSGSGGEAARWTYSTWKSRKGREVKCLIDYIWYSRRHFEVLWTLDAPPPAEMGASASKLPDSRYPSDHLALAAKLRIIA
jgi:nocturnin